MARPTDDEPMFARELAAAAGGQGDAKRVRARIAAVLEQERYGVLCTQGDAQPYGSLIAFAVSPGCRHLVFATPVHTRKYRLLQACPQVAVVVDTRARHPDRLMEVEGLTATGCARIVTGTVAEPWRQLLLERHPSFAEFVAAPSSAVVAVEVARYFYVARFQEVHQWTPGAA